MPHYLKVGQLARHAGISIRTLHHYDRLHLVSPSLRSHARHRLYTPRDVRRLALVLLLRGMGLALRDIRTALAPQNAASPSALRDCLAQRAGALARQINQLRTTHARLETLLRLMTTTHTVSAENTLQLLETLTMLENHYTPEQLAQLEQRRQSLDPQVVAAAEKEWPDLMARMKKEFDAGTDPADPRVRALARRWKELVNSFTGNDPAIAQSLQSLWKKEGPTLAAQHNLPFDPQLFDYVRRAQQANVAQD